MNIFDSIHSDDYMSEAFNETNFTIKKEYGVVDKRGIYNACVITDAYPRPLRGKSEMIVIRGNEMFLNKSSRNSQYRLPGGSWDKGESHKESAIRETKEEARIIISGDPEYITTRIEIHQEPNEWVRKNIPENDWWYGYYCEIYIGAYGGEFSGHINKNDRDDNMVKYGKFYPIDEVYDMLIPEHKYAIDKYFKRIPEPTTESSGMSYLEKLSHNELSNLVRSDKPVLINKNMVDSYNYDPDENENEHVVFYYSDKGDFVGVVEVYDSKMISGLYVEDLYHGQGFGTKLLLTAIDKFGGNQLLVDKDNSHALKLYKKFGFDIVGRKTIHGNSLILMKLNRDKYERFKSSYINQYQSSIKMESGEETYIITNDIYPIVSKVLSTPQGDKKFRELIRRFIDRNSSKLQTAGPVYLVPFTDADKEEFFHLFNTTKAELNASITTMTKMVNDKASWKLLRQNPIFCLFYECIRYYTLKKNETGVNSSLAIYALAVYPSVFSMVFQYGADPDVMQYTMDNLSAKYILKQSKNVFNGLVVSIQNSYKFLKESIIDGNDKEVLRFIARIRNDQKSLLKNIANHYYNNHKKGLRVSTQSEVYSDGEMIDSNLNNTSAVEDVARKVSLSLVTNGVDLTRATASAKIAGVSISDLRFYLSKILITNNNDDLYKFVEAILFTYLYKEHHQPYEINEKKFLQFSLDLFRRTNSSDENIVTIKSLLQKWSTDTGITEKYRRLASQINYKRGIYTYIILCIQYYN